MLFVGKRERGMSVDLCLFARVKEVCLLACFCWLERKGMSAGSCCLSTGK